MFAGRIATLVLLRTARENALLFFTAAAAAAAVRLRTGDRSDFVKRRFSARRLRGPLLWRGEENALRDRSYCGEEGIR